MVVKDRVYGGEIVVPSEHRMIVLIILIYICWSVIVRRSSKPMMVNDSAVATVDILMYTVYGTVHK